VDQRRVTTGGHTAGVTLRSRAEARRRFPTARLSSPERSRSDAGRRPGRGVASSEMELRPYKVTVDRHQVLVFREDLLVGTGRWTGTAIEDLSPPLLPEAPGEEAALLASLG